MARHQAVNDIFARATTLAGIHAAHENAEITKLDSFTEVTARQGENTLT